MAVYNGFVPQVGLVHLFTLQPHWLWQLLHWHQGIVARVKRWVCRSQLKGLGFAGVNPGSGEAQIGSPISQPAVPAGCAAAAHQWPQTAVIQHPKWFQTATGWDSSSRFRAIGQINSSLDVVFNWSAGFNLRILTACGKLVDDGCDSLRKCTINSSIKNTIRTGRVALPLPLLLAFLSWAPKSVPRSCTYQAAGLVRELLDIRTARYSNC